MSDTPEIEPENEHGDEELLRKARARFQLAAEAESDIRKEALDDLKFAAGDQWPDDVRMSRSTDRRPCLTINRIPQFIRQITNDQRQNRPSIKVSPVDDEADIDTAKIIQGMIRHIEYASDADTAYDTAFDSAVRGGFGYFRIVTNYSSPTSFDQDIKIKRIRNRFSVYLDPSYQQPDGSDAKWGFVFEDMSDDEFKAQYPDAKMSDMADWTSIGDSLPGWATKDHCRVAEYFYIETKTVEIVKLSDGSTFKTSQLPAVLGAGITIQDRRMSQDIQVKWCKINAVEVLDRTDIPGKFIPIIPVLGDEQDIDGKKTLEGIVRHAKDSQRMYNYQATNEAETIALAPRAPWIGMEGQFEGHEEAWQTANIKNHAFLQYKAKSINGVLQGPPQRNTFEPPIAAITQARAQAADDMKATTGIYDASLGNRSNEQSGVAIQRRNTQSQTSNFHFMDNLSKSIRHAGRVIVGMIPNVYDTARATRILGADGNDEVVMLNQIFQHNGKSVKYDVGIGEYDVVVDTGPSFETKRQESVSSMIDLSKSFPQLMGNAADIMVKQMDWPGAQEIADRLKRSLPPGIVDDKNGSQIPPQAQQQMAKMNQMIQQLTQHLHDAQDKVDAKTLELQSKERIALASIRADLEITLAKLQASGAETLLEHQISEIQGREENLQNIQQNQNGAGPNAAVSPQVQQPTGGQSPGSNMGAP